MSTVIGVPVVIPANVTEYVAELGYEKQFEAMLQHVRENVPELVRIEVERYERLEKDDHDGMCITVFTLRPSVETEAAFWTLNRWVHQNFPPEVCDVFIYEIHSDRPQV